MVSLTLTDIYVFNGLFEVDVIRSWSTNNQFNSVYVKFIILKL